MLRFQGAFHFKSIVNHIKALIMAKEAGNPGILVDGSLLNLGLDIIEWGIVIVSMAILICVSVLNYRMEEAGEKKNVRMLIAERPVVIRWILYVGFLFYVILLAKYGPGYSAAEFIYKDF